MIHKIFIPAVIAFQSLSIPLSVSAGPEISKAELRAHVEFLASPELEGREAGYRGADAAARYIATRFREYGLRELPGAPGYYQQVPLLLMRPDFEMTVLSVVRGGEKTDFVTDRDLFFYPKGGDDDYFEAPVVFCGYGITASELGYDDYEHADVAGKFVLVMNREPQLEDSNSIFNGTSMTKYSIPMIKARTAKEHGVKALLIMRPPTESHPLLEETLKRYREQLEKPIVQLAGKIESLPVFYLKDETAAEILGDSFDLDGYFQDIEKKLKPKPIAIDNVMVNVKIRFREREEIESPNVAGFIPGNDSSSEMVIIGAHYDHLGITGGGICFGADDNASGVAGLLELAEAFSEVEEKSNRGVLFIAFTAEEKGALGSLYYTQNPLHPINRTAAMINLDEIGRNGASTFSGMRDPDLETKGANYLMVQYSAQSPLLKKINEQANVGIGLDLDFDPNVHFHGSSDQVHFHNLTIPSLFYFTGFQPDYHTPRDTPDKINYIKMEKVVKLVYRSAARLAQLKEEPAFDAEIKRVPKKKRMDF